MDNEKWKTYLAAGKGYDTVQTNVGSTMKMAHKIIEESIPIPPEGNILVIGTGGGEEMEKFQELSPDSWVTGITLSPKEHEHCIKKKLDVKIADMHKLPYKYETFDILFTSNTLEHSISPFIAMCEMNRVLKMGGYALIIIPSVWRWGDINGHISCMTSEQMVFLARKCGFTTLDSWWVMDKSKTSRMNVFILKKEKIIHTTEVIQRTDKEVEGLGC